MVETSIYSYKTVNQMPGLFSYYYYYRAVSPAGVLKFYNYISYTITEMMVIQF